jgi:hypothetical protein
MSFVVIGRQMISLPLAIRIEEDSIEKALAVIQSMLVESGWTVTQEEDGSETGYRQVLNGGYQAWLLIDEDSGEIKRLYHNASDQLCVTDGKSAFELLGSATDYKHYEGEPDGTA